MSGSGANRGGWVDLAGKKRSAMLGEAGFKRVEGRQLRLIICINLA